MQRSVVWSRDATRRLRIGGVVSGSGSRGFSYFGMRERRITNTADLTSRTSANLTAVSRTLNCRTFPYERSDARP